MKARLAVSAVLVALLAVGTSGCTFMTPQVTTIAYDASDGVGTTVGDIQVLNALLVSEDGENASLIVSLHNSSAYGVQVKVQYENATNTKVDESVFVNARSVNSLGAAGPSDVVLTGIDAPPGSLFPVFFQYGDETGSELWLPVLEPKDAYKGLAPAPKP